MKLASICSAGLIVNSGTSTTVAMAVVPFVMSAAPLQLESLAIAETAIIPSVLAVESLFH